MIIKVNDEINNALDFNKSATELMGKLNQSDKTEFTIDFEGVFYISRSFAQVYYASKNRSSKKITEINLSDDVKPMMEMIETQLMD